MRSNGAVHLGNDTFLAVTRDATDHVYLFTSRFPAAERVADLGLPRRARFYPSSSVDLSEEQAARCMAAYQRLQSRRLKLASKGSTADSGDPVRVVPSGRDDNNGANEKGGSSSSGNSEGDDADHADTCLLTRHTLRVSCDGQRVAAISNRHRQHYVMDVTHDPIGIAEFETEELVRSAVWHPTVPYLFITLSVSGMLTVYDASAVHLSVLFQRTHQTDLKPMLHVLLADKLVMVQQQKGLSKMRAEAAAAGDSGRDSCHCSAPAAKSNASARSSSSVSDPRWSESAVSDKRSAGGCDGGRKNREKNTDSMLPTSGKNSATPKAGNIDTLLADVRAALHGPTGNQQQSPPSKKQQQSAVHGEGGVPTSAAIAAVSRRSTTTFDGATAHAGRSTLHTTEDKKKAGHEVLTTAFTGAAAARRNPLALYATAAEADGTVAVSRTLRVDTTSTALDLVDMCMVEPSLSLPPTLLLLSSSGDVFSVKLNPYCLPAMGRAVAPNGSMPVTDAETRAAAEAREVLERMPHVCHVVQGHAKVERGRCAHAPTGTSEDEKDDRAGGESDRDCGCEQQQRAEEEEEEAVAVRCCRVDEDTGLHAITIVYASGLVRGAWVDEPDLIARQRVSGCEADFRKYGASNFTIHLGSALSARSFLSPTVPTTTHTVQVNTQGNVLLLRLGGGNRHNEAAYLIAFPVLDRHRRGWSYWMPQAAVEAARRPIEAMRLPLVSTDVNTVPEPLALRLPLDVRGASIAIGGTDVLVFPELAADSGTDTCPRGKVATLTIPSLLRSALYARSVGVQMNPPSANGGDNSIRLSTQAQPTTSELIANMFECHRRFLSACPPAVVDEQTAALADRVQETLASVQSSEASTAHREAELHARVGALQQRVKRSAEELGAWTATLLDAITNRRGAGAIRTANARLGIAHDILTEYESALAQQQHRR